MARRILITGCSGGGKSTLLEALAARGFATVAEPGRRVISEHGISPETDPIGFATKALEIARRDLAVMSSITGPVFFDRGVIDAATALLHSADVPLSETLGPRKAYDRTVILAPPWPEIYVTDQDRKHGFEAAEQEYVRLTNTLAACGYVAINLPKATVENRVVSTLQAFDLAT